jgi:hypothetical protein
MNALRKFRFDELSARGVTNFSNPREKHLRQEQIKGVNVSPSPRPARGVGLVREAGDEGVHGYRVVHRLQCADGAGAFGGGGGFVVEDGEAGVGGAELCEGAEGGVRDDFVGVVEERGEVRGELRLREAREGEDGFAACACVGGLEAGENRRGGGACECRVIESRRGWSLGSNRRTRL